MIGLVHSWTICFGWKYSFQIEEMNASGVGLWRRLIHTCSYRFVQLSRLLQVNIAPSYVRAFHLDRLNRLIQLFSLNSVIFLLQSHLLALLLLPPLSFHPDLPVQTIQKTVFGHLPPLTLPARPVQNHNRKNNSKTRHNQ